MKYISLQHGVDVIKRKAQTLSMAPGVYRMLSEAREVLYVGKAKHLKNRVLSYTQPAQLPVRLKRMISLTRNMEFILTKSEEEALLLEAQLIKKLKPRFNVLLRDDKSFPYILMTNHSEAPQLVKYRGKPQLSQGEYFGPFASTRALDETMDTLSRLFRLRTCSDAVYKNRTRPCLQYHIKRCSAPCVGCISQEEYAQNIRHTRDFLMGKTRSLQADLEKEMMRASAQEQFEKAAVYRDRIRSMDQIQQRSPEMLSSLVSADFFALFQKEGHSCVQVFFYRHGTSYGNRAYFPKHDKDQKGAELLGSFVAQFYQSKSIPKAVYLSESVSDIALLERALQTLSDEKISVKVPKKGAAEKVMQQAVLNAQQALERHQLEQMSTQKMLEQVRDYFSLSEKIQRIEIYDNSHLHGTNAYGTMVVSGPEGFDKKAYRQFKIKGESGRKGDDYGMMREVFQRRFRETSQKDMPQLIFIDGGKGQLSVALEVLNSLSLQTLCIGVAKGEERNAGRETLYFSDGSQKSVEQDHPVTFYIQRLRDEAHRFAIGTHRKGRSKKMLHSELQDIPGIGPKRKKALMTYFGGMEGLKSASVETYKKVPGISPKLAQQLYRYFQGE